MADYNLGRAEGEIALKYNRTGATQVKRDVDDLQARGRTAGASMDRLGRTSTIAGAAIAGGLALAINAAANFEQRLSGIKAVSGATTSQMEAIRKKALQLGADTKFSASQAAQAMEELAKAGLTIPEIMNGAADATVALAAAGEIDLPRAAEIAANAMNTFNLSAEDLPKVADLVAGAANASAISVEEFAQSLQQSGAAANLAGLSFVDLSAAIALMGNAGIKGSDAGTSLKTMLLNLNPSTKKQIALFKELGIITKDGANQFFDAQGKAKGLADIAGVLSKSLEGMTQQQKLAALEVMFGSDAIRAAAVLANAGAKGFENMAGAMTKVKAADVAATRMDNLKGKIEQMRGSLETAAIVIGSIVIPALTTFVKYITGLVNAFAQLSPGMQKAIVVVAGVVAAFLLILGVVIKIISIMTALQVAIAAGFAPFLIVAAIIAAVIALGAAIYLLYQRFEPVRNVVDAVGHALKTAFIATLPVIQRVGEIFMTTVLPALIAVGKFLATTFGPIFVRVGAIIAGWVRAIIGYFQSINPQLTAIFNVLRAIWNAVWPPLLVIVRFIFGQVLSFVISTLKLLATGIMLVLNGIANIFRGVFNIIGGIIKIFLSLITGQWGAAWEGVKQVVRGVLQIILGLIQTILGVAIIAIVVSSVKAIGAVFKAGWAIVRGVVTSVMGAIRAVISGGMSFAGGIVRRYISIIVGTFRTMTNLIGVVNGIFARIVSVIGSVFGRAVSVVTGVLGRVVGAVTGFGGRLFAAGAAIIQRLVAGITSRIGAVIDTIKGAVSKAMSFLPGSPVKEGPARVLNRGHAGKQIINMLIDGINARRSDLAAAMRSVALSVPTTVDATAGALAASASRTGTGAPTTLVAPASGPSAEALAEAVMKGLEGARFEFGPDGLARIVTGSLIPAFVMGGQA